MNYIEGVVIFPSLKQKEWYKKSSYVHLWLHLLLKAKHNSMEYEYNKKKIIINEGQIFCGRTGLSHETGLSSSTIDKILNFFEEENMIKQEHFKNHFRIITIVNWEKYQKLCEEKIEEKKKSKSKCIGEFDKLIPDSLKDREFIEAWHQWERYRKEIRHSLTKSTANMQLKKLNSFGLEKAIASIYQSIEHGWIGLFEPRFRQKMEQKFLDLTKEKFDE